MMKETAIVSLLGLFLCSIPYASYGVPVSCMMAYEEGGVSAVFSSFECPNWVLSDQYSQNSTKNCSFSTLQGHRKYQEDRIACNMDMKLPFSDNDGRGEVSIGVAAIFDGHIGSEASEMASKKLLDYFFVHAVFTAYKQVLPNNKNYNEAHNMTIESSLHGILEEALLRALQDIDSEFTQEALEKRCFAGSTGVVVLLVNGQFLIANIGDSKALLCSKRIHSQHDIEDTSLKGLVVEELTIDHRPDREDEKARIEAAGGVVQVWRNMPLVNGNLPMSRAIGDVYLKRYGIIADPEITGWRPLTPEHAYLDVASDGIFESLTPQHVCDLLHDKVSEDASLSTLADWISQSAFNAGSVDNLSAIVISVFNNTKN